MPSFPIRRLILPGIVLAVATIPLQSETGPASRERPLGLFIDPENADESRLAESQPAFPRNPESTTSVIPDEPVLNSIQ